MAGMGNVSIFVDAGYLFKQGAGAVLNEKLGRREVGLDGRQFVGDLADWICGLYENDELLRTYWYDGARRGVPGPEQLDVAALPFLKFRLGRINASGQQKGVDTLIVRDMMVLSQERSIHRAVVLSGDEDLREGIEYAQDRGVRVAVAGIDFNGDLSQSPELMREADEHLIVPKDILERSIHRRVAASTAPRTIETVKQVESPTDDPTAQCVHCAEDFARDWLSRANAEEIAAIVAARPRIPQNLDASILQFTVRKTGIHTIGDEPRRAMRVAFWAAIDSR
jgi:hypothetical protein